ncbi:MAG: hypothetical protein EPO00_03125 [Chloroflexota bacterium]|nr:MAG: hypothetical protein EPO00_03125 [Chloroflexota bacterium]
MSSPRVIDLPRSLRTLRLAPPRFVVPVALVLAVMVAACGGAGPSPTRSPGGSPSPTDGPTSDPASIEHATGALDVVFRFEQGGGFVPMGFFATQAPQFTLYGDGTVIFRDFSAGPPANDKVGALQPYLIAHMSEAEIQGFLRFALADSGLGVARAAYNPGNVADAPSSMFTIHAGGVDKVVTVEALGFENPQNPDSAILKALAGLGERISNFATSVNGEAAWTPDRWRGILTPDGFGPATAWPWPDLKPTDFVQPVGADAPQFPIHTLTTADVDALGLTGIEGGFTNLPLTGPDNKLYTLALRPILPDESR